MTREVCATCRWFAVRPETKTTHEYPACHYEPPSVQGWPRVIPDVEFCHRWELKKGKTDG